MPSSYSDLLRLELMATGENDGTWGQKANDNVFKLIEHAIAGFQTVDVGSGNVTLSALNGAEDQSRKAMLKFTGSPGTARTVTIPAKSKTYVCWNAADDVVTVKTSSGSGVAIPPGQRCLAFCDGTDVYRAEAAAPQGKTTLTISSGEITLTGFAHAVDTEGGAASDSLETINPGVVGEGQFVLLWAEDASRGVTVEDGADNIHLDGGDCVLSTVRPLVLVRRGSDFYEVSRPWRSGAVAWALVNGTGVAAILASHGVSGLVDNAQGNYTIQFDPDFASANYACSCSGEPGQDDIVVQTFARGQGSVNVVTRNMLSGVNTDAIFSITVSGEVVRD